MMNQLRKEKFIKLVLVAQSIFLSSCAERKQIIPVITEKISFNNFEMSSNLEKDKTIFFEGQYIVSEIPDLVALQETQAFNLKGSGDRSLFITPDNEQLRSWSVIRISKNLLLLVGGSNLERKMSDRTWLINPKLNSVREGPKLKLSRMASALAC